MESGDGKLDGDQCCPAVCVCGPFDSGRDSLCGVVEAEIKVFGFGCLCQKGRDRKSWGEEKGERIAFQGSLQGKVSGGFKRLPFF